MEAEAILRRAHRCAGAVRLACDAEMKRDIRGSNPATIQAELDRLWDRYHTALMAVLHIKPTAPPLVSLKRDLLDSDGELLALWRRAVRHTELGEASPC
jgi:hypothetical protein